MARQTKEEKRIDAAADAAFYKHGNQIQFNIMDLGKIHDAGVVAGRAGGDIEAAVVAAITKYRAN